MGKLTAPGLTFDDVLIRPNYSHVVPSEVDLSTRFSRRIGLNIPLVSAAMDTVTEHSLAVALARAGGIGVVHKGLTPERQAHEVRMVKRSQAGGMILNPMTFPPDAAVADARRVMEETRVSGFPIIADDRLVGIVTNRDLRFVSDPATPLSAIMTTDLVTAPPGVSTAEAQRLLQSRQIEKLPIVDPDGRLVGLITYRDMAKALDHPGACRDDQGRLRVAAAVGVSDGLKRAPLLVEAGVDALVVDSAHGFSKNVLTLVGDLVRRFPSIDVIAGNIATGEGAIALAEAGAAAVKVGMGPGASCTTRVVSGCGVPQITAILEVVESLDGADTPIIADGGIRYSGDVAKALAAGAWSVMIGSLFAGTEESPGETILYEGRTYKAYRGMGSLGVMSRGADDRYWQQGITDAAKLVPEGIEGRMPYKGQLADLVFQLLGGLRAGMGYCGVPNLKAFREQAELIPVTAAGSAEGHPSVEMVRGAPNYAGR